MEKDYVESEIDDLLLIEEQELEDTLDLSKELSELNESEENE